MRLFNNKNDKLILTKEQWIKLFVAFSIMVIALYTVAMIFSLCGSNYFILNYQNTQMDKIESWLSSVGAMPSLKWAFTTLEFIIISSFVLHKRPRWYFVLAFYAIPVVLAILFPSIPMVVYKAFPFLFYFLMPLAEKRFKKDYAICLLRLLIAVSVVFVLQIMINIIKSGGLNFSNVEFPLSSAFIYAIEYDIALSVILYTLVLLLDKEKGDSIWATYHGVGSSSQTSKKKLQRSNLTKTQKNKLFWLYARIFICQLGAFLLLMVLPFFLGKVFEFLVMYLAFAISRAILGFKYSLHFKKESLCATVGAVVFGILSLAVPFFYIVLIIALTIGVGLAVLLHLSYKYEGFYLFNKIARPDRYAELYVIMDGDLTSHHVKIMCKHKGLDKFQTEFILDFAEGNKKSYLAKKYSYSEKTIDRKLDELLEILDKNS